jgi:cytochrome bd-type quinol oxidase subunit 2
VLWHKGIPGSDAANARKTILNACVGLVIAISAISIVNFISQIYVGGGNTGQGLAFNIPLWDAEHVVNSILNVFYFVIGIVAVIIIIISGYMFTVAGSEPSTLARAKNMIYYAVIGLAVAFFAFVITHFIIGRIG